jgi:phage shock protein PspC (stress-responsive transcriptional regulator)
MGSYFGCDSTLMRVGWVLAAFASGGLGILAYLVLIFVVPNEPTDMDYQPRTMG